MRNKTLGLVAALFVVLPSVLSIASPQAAPRLSGTVWKWNRSLSSDGSSKTAADPNRYLIEFAPDGSAAIQADCNRVLGAYKTDGNTMTITAGAGTKVACPPGSQERDYVNQLSMVSSYFFKDGALYLEFKYDSGTMTFTPSAPAGLAGSAWNVVNYNNGKQAVVSIVNGSKITLNFAAGGRVSGSGGCNNFSGGFESTETAIKFSQLAATEMACMQPNGVMNQETLYLKALANSSTYKIEGNRLTLRDAGGAMQVVASR